MRRHPSPILYDFLTHSFFSNFSPVHPPPSTASCAYRYVAFVVLFHAMAKSSQPLLYWAWNIAFSQSSLRVATTAAPIVARVHNTADKSVSPQEATRRAEFHMAIETLVARRTGYSNVI